VTGIPHAEWGWACLRVAVRDTPAEGLTRLGDIGVDWARFVFADADALGGWVHEESIDGLADVVFWGRDEEDVAEEFGAECTGTRGEEKPVRDAYVRAVELGERRTSTPERRFAYDFRPHSHHWQVMADVRASEYEAATIDVGGARMLFATTSVGDGFFPVRVHHDSTGALATIQIAVQEHEES
jgi:hypothetical protein